MEYLISSWYVFSMVVTRRFVTGSGSGSGSGDGGQEGPARPEVVGQMRADELDAGTNSMSSMNIMLILFPYPLNNSQLYNIQQKTNHRL